MNHEWIGPDIRNSVFVHILHLLLLGGVGVCAWQAISAFTRKPTRVLEGIRKVVYGAWLVVLFLLITKLSPVPYLGAATFIAVLLLVFKQWDRMTARAPEMAEQPLARLGR